MTDQPLICAECQGVIVAVPGSAYTPARGRLIITNGYCRGQCSEAEPAHDEPSESESTPAPR